MPSDCEHVTHDPELRRFYRDNPDKLCARCFFAGRAVLLLRDGTWRALAETD